MRILVDTSVWVDHLRNGNDQLAGLLKDGSVLHHRFVVGELACGNLRNRAEILALLEALPETPGAEHLEVLQLVALRQLSGRGLGWVDAHLLASAILTGCTLWTFDQALGAAAVALKVASE
jgi:hypothetical protein